MTLADLKVTGVDNFQYITSIDIVEKVHTHGICNISFSMKKEFKPDKVINFAKKKITVKAKDKIIFCGLITSYRVESVGGAIFLYVTAQTLSCQLKTSEKKSCTFQKADKKFSNILGELKKNYSDADFSFEEDKKISGLLYRDNLNDWDFLTEVAESQGQILFCDSKSDRLKISIGFKSFKDFSDDKTIRFLRQSVALDFFKRLEQNTYSSARSAYFIDTALFTENPEIGVGCGVKYDNQVQAVISSHVYLRENILCNEITIRHKEGCRAEAWDVTKFFDRSFYLTGKVLEAKDNDVKVQFDCDEKQDKNDALKIPYESAVSNYLYTMPDEKDKVFVYADKLRQSAMGSLRTKDASDDAKNKSFKTKISAMAFDAEKISFDAEKKSELVENEQIKFSAKKDIIFSASGNIFIQSAAQMSPDNQLTMIAPQSAGYIQYTATGGQPPSVQFNPAGSTVGTTKPTGTAKESVELSDLAKELNKLTNTQGKKSDSKSSGGGAGGTIKVEGKSSLTLKVSDSSIECKGSDVNIKTSLLNQVGYIPAAGGGTGSGGGGPGKPKVSSAKVKAEKGTEDRSRQKENISATEDNKNISA